jgi:hypothetical protein
MNQNLRNLILGLGLLSTLNPQLSTCLAQPTAFTYQGRLDENGGRANGIYDFRFTLYNGSDFTNATSALSVSDADDVAVSNGLFSAQIGAPAWVFSGAPRWLAIEVRTNDTGELTLLEPWTEITPAPYAVRALTVASNGLESYEGVVTLTNPSNHFVGTFSGDGGALSNVASATLGGLSASNFWQLGGNAGTTAGADFLGTTDNQPLELRVNGERVFRLEPGTNTPNILGGSSSNSIDAGVQGSTIAGGGLPSFPNRITADFATVGGGTFHIAGGAWSTIAGGRDNRVYSESSGILSGRANLVESNSLESVIVGGEANSVREGSFRAFIGGGYFNRIETNADYSVIVGGVYNTNESLAFYSTIGGGLRNRAETNASYAVLDGGINNSAGAGFRAVTVGGGEANRAAANHATVAGGLNNTNAGPGATIGGGNANSTLANDTVIAGGIGNQILETSYQTEIGGGGFNSVGTNSWYVTIGGGRGNQVSDNASQATIAGGQANAIGNRSGRSSIGAGYLNAIAEESQGARIDGGFSNLINTNSDYSSIGGGINNRVETNVFAAVVGGGEGNQVTGQHSTVSGGILNENTGLGATIGGGNRNATAANDTAIAGGTRNTIETDSLQSSIGGGGYNSISSNSPYATIAGGSQNLILSNASTTTIAGGWLNGIGEYSYHGSVGGGYSNRLQYNGYASTISGGEHNTVASNSWKASLGGGARNAILAYEGGTIGGGVSNAVSGGYATVPGGLQNAAAGTYSQAGGRRAKANHTGSFVWADSTDADFASTANNQFLIRASGGVGINTPNPTAKLHVGGTPGVDGIRFPDGTLQTSAAVVPPAPPQVVFASGLGSNPLTTNNFLAAPVTVTVTSSSQQILVTSHKAFGSTAVGGANLLNLYIGHRPSGGGSVTTVGGGIFGNQVAQNTRVTMGLSAVITGLTPGTYQVGLAGNSANAANWNNNEFSYTTAVVY